MLSPGFLSSLVRYIPSLKHEMMFVSVRCSSYPVLLYQSCSNSQANARLEQCVTLKLISRACQMCSQSTAVTNAGLSPGFVSAPFVRNDEHWEENAAHEIKRKVTFIQEKPSLAANVEASGFNLEVNVHPIIICDEEM